MKDYNDLLADQLGCEKAAIADTLFPREKGFTEEERIKFCNAIFSAMSVLDQRVSPHDNEFLICGYCSALLEEGHHDWCPEK